MARVNAEWRAVLTEAFAQPRRELGIPLPLEALVSLVMTFNLGIIIERLGGIETGHRELLDWIEQLDVQLAAPGREQSRARYPDRAPGTSSATACACITRSTALAGTAVCSPSMAAATAAPTARRPGTRRRSSPLTPSR
jgi:hypothetical protein